MKFIKKNWVLLLMASVIMAALLTACGGATETQETTGTTSTPAAQTPAPAQGGNEPATDEPVHLTWWVLDEQLDSAGMNHLIASFQTSYPHVTIDVFGHSNETLHQNLQISAMNDTLPSIWFQWGGVLGGRYVQYGVTRHLTDFARENNTVPTNIEEFHDIVETIHAAGIIPINTASVPGWHIMRFWEQMLEHYAGAAMHDQLQIFNVDWEGNQAVIDSFAALQRYARSGFFPEGFISMEAADLPLLIYPGLAAMQIEGPWFDRNLLLDEQDMSNFGVFALPNGGTNRVSAVVRQSITIFYFTSVDTPHPPRFFQFVHLATQPPQPQQSYNIYQIAG